ncbi:AbrB/MazE/SpoVT family DNA-binding domain-containing protein [Raoultibacter phocaeensis]|uniref:AbrB/MazE/SpoVT family DNA-binding domain-containing protein n=1 Tax=Raoultibacter phocaeensis TaxID=2479841 RepID=UPI00111B474E|nr:AbrB/MazE/SpoVT family DNA-binding domain-containing protein [Raoultibacter phocaeensis]
METTISRWGNSEAVRIPREVLRLVGLRSGDQVGFEVNEQGRIELVPVEAAHRRIVPTKGVTFDALFKHYKGGVASSENAWPDDDLVGAEWDAWSR